ncbi:chemotaxis protein CheA [Carboxylicivirga linearis]|uniref:Chemotaxis protein CheA n=2 Tax=Carboxylicivirga linearis TaxID=1628157 RepID=A0ABS5K1W1_9BACT|nr:chemotaxis protein CheA [Carboxylicivirga linearis]
MERIILNLEKNPSDVELIQEVFRVMHTIKGVSGMYGYTAISDLTHHIENIFDLIRSGSLKVDKEILDTTLMVVDHLFALLKDEKVEDPSLALKQKELIHWCVQFIKDAKGKIFIKEFVESDSELVTYNVILHTHQSVVDRRINLFYAIKDLAAIGEIKNISPLPVQDDNEERWSIFIVGDFSFDDIEEALMFVYEYCIIRKVADYNIFDEEQSDIVHEELEKEELDYIATSNRPKSTVINKSVGSNTNKVIESIKQNITRISVDSSKLDYLMYLVSELITTSSQLNISSRSNSVATMLPHIQKLDRLSKLFRNNALEIRLIPIGDVVPKFNRLVRDVSNSLGKEIEFVTEGMETELDKSSIDMVTEPLVHMIRNSLDHGIELPEERLAKGKSEKGTIKLKASSSGNDIFIEVSDDGKGLDKDRIIEKALEQGVLDRSEDLSDEQVFNIICKSGFSTNEVVSSLSGRGVGMDVVKQKISEMRGELDICSRPGEGTKFTIKLQQSIAILDTLLVRSGKMKFLLPLSDIEVCSQMLYSNIDKRIKYSTVDFENELTPFVSLRNLFDISEEKPKMAKMVVIRKNNKRLAFFTDEIVGQHQAVIKPMGELVKKHEEISAASVLGNGEIAFLLDTNMINQNVYKKSAL